MGGIERRLFREFGPRRAHESGGRSRGSRRRHRRSDAGAWTSHGRGSRTNGNREGRGEAAGHRLLIDRTRRRRASGRRPPILPRLPRDRGRPQVARRGAGLLWRMCDVSPGGRNARGPAGACEGPEVYRDHPGRSGCRETGAHRRDGSRDDRHRVPATLLGRAARSCAAHRPGAASDPGLGLHESGRARCESGGCRNHREPRRSGTRGHLPRGHVARTSIRHRRNALGERGLLLAEPVPAEGRLRGTGSAPGALRMRIRARGIVPGQASGFALVSLAPFSFVGGVDPATGSILNGATGSTGERLDGRVFVFPAGKGSTVGSYVLYGLGKRGHGPVAIVNRRADSVVAVGATLAGIPMVDRVDLGCLRAGDRVVVDGSRGTIELPDIRAKRVVTAILRNRGRILIVRRSEKVGTFQGKWSAISGRIEGREDPKRRAIVEVREETGIRAITFRGAGDPVLARDGTTIYVVHPFLFDTSNRRVRLDWENVEHRWVRPEELERFESVPRLVDVVAAVLQPSA